MKISEKIAEIRLKPEHVRMRYVWGSVAVCMVIIFTIWIFSITAMFQGQMNSPKQAENETGNIAKQLQELKQQAPSFKDYTDQSLTTENEGVTPPVKGSSDFQYPTTTNNSEIPQASAYSDLPVTTPAQ